MKFSSYIALRTAYILFSLFGLSVLVFTLARVLPGDPARLALGPRVPQSVVDALRKQLRLDQPLYTQYIYWLNDLFHGNLGYSLYTRGSVTDAVLLYLPASLELITLAALFEIAGAFLLGVIAGRYSYKWPDNVVRIISYIGISIPAFVMAIILELLFGMIWPIFPASGNISVLAPTRITGFITIDSLITGRFDAFANVMWHMILPALALCIGGMMQDARIIRTMAKCEGLPERQVMFKYLLKPSIIPAITVMGLDIAALLSNAFLVETVFNWPGFSKLGITLMLNKDLNGIVALVLIIGIMYAVINIITDVIVAYLDPRIRLMERGE
jgi:peptide/nickel transport system permease protein